MAFSTDTTADGLIVSTTDSPANLKAAIALGETVPVETPPAPADGPSASPAPGVPAGEPAASEPELPETEPDTRDEKGRFKSKDAKARIDALTAKHREAERQNQAYQQQLTQRDQELARYRQATQPRQAPVQQAPAPVASSDAPNPEEIGSKYATYEDYVRALARYEAKAELETTLRAQQQTYAQQAAQHHMQQAVQAHISRSTDYLAAHPDASAVIQAGDAALQQAGISDLPPTIKAAIFSSERGPEILHHFGSHPDVMLSLLREHWQAPPEAAPVMRRLLESLVSAPASLGSGAPTLRSTAPAPPKPLGAAPVVQSSTPDDLEFGPEYVRQQNARERATRGRR